MIEKKKQVHVPYVEVSLERDDRFQYQAQFAEMLTDTVVGHACSVAFPILPA
jgi:hypothetical protein